MEMINRAIEDARDFTAMMEKIANGATAERQRYAQSKNVHERPAENRPYETRAERRKRERTELNQRQAAAKIKAKT